jgi:hypothetical protein
VDPVEKEMITLIKASGGVHNYDDKNETLKGKPQKDFLHNFQLLSAPHDAGMFFESYAIIKVAFENENNGARHKATFNDDVICNSSQTCQPDGEVLNNIADQLRRESV